MTVEDKLRREMAKKYGVSLGQIHEIVMCQDRFVADVIGKKSDRKRLYFPSVRLPGFGVFFCPESRLRRYKESNQKDATISDR